MLDVNKMRKSLLKAAIEGKLTNSDLESWQWVKLGHIVSKTIKRGKSPRYTSHSGTLVFAQKCNTKKGNIDLSLALYLDEATLSKYPDDEFMRDGDVIINSTGRGTLGRIGYYRDSDNPQNLPLVPDSHVTIIRTRENIASRFVYYALKHLQPKIEGLGTGTTNQTELSAKVVNNLLIPLPPLSEQALIVSKLDALFDCLDKLDSAQKKFEHDKEIFRKSILKAAFEEAGTLGEWVKLGDVGEYKKGPFGSSLTKSIFVSDSSEAVKVYEQKNAIRKNHEIGKYFITRQYYESKMKGFTVKPGDIIVSCAGTIGETYLLPDEAREGIINQALMRIRLNDNVNKAYFLYCFEAVVMAKAKGKGSAIKNIPPFAIFKNILIPLPPLEEQRRIVKRLDELMSVIDSLSDTESTKHVI